MFRLPRARLNCVTPAPPLGLLLVDPEHHGLVAIERHRLAVLLEVRTHRREVRECRLRLAEPKLHQGAGCIVHEHQQGTARGALLEPLVVGAVDLDEFAPTRPTAPGLLDRRLSTRPRDPEAVVDHPVPERLDRELQPVQLRQLLVGERRAEALVPGPDGGQRLPAQLQRQPPMAGSAAMLRRQAHGAVPYVGAPEATHLPARQAQHPRGLTLRQPPLDHALHHAHAVQFLVAHRHSLHGRGGTAGGWRKRTFLLWRKPDIFILVLQPTTQFCRCYCPPQARQSSGAYPGRI